MEERQTIKLPSGNHFAIHTASRVRRVSGGYGCAKPHDRGKQYRSYWHRGGAVIQGGREMYDKH